MAQVGKLVVINHRSICTQAEAQQIMRLARANKRVVVCSQIIHTHKAADPRRGLLKTQHRARRSCMEPQEPHASQAAMLVVNASSIQPKSRTH